AIAEEMFRPVGRTVRLPESQQDAVTAVSGSGPAYFYFLVEAMTDAGILLGLPRQAAHDLIVQTAIGSAIMLRDSGEHPVKLREAVTSPAGTTINAIRELENHGVRAALLAALEAARDRARQIAEQQLCTRLLARSRPGPRGEGLRTGAGGWRFRTGTAVGYPACARSGISFVPRGGNSAAPPAPPPRPRTSASTTGAPCPARRCRPGRISRPSIRSAACCPPC